MLLPSVIRCWYTMLNLLGMTRISWEQRIHVQYFQGSCSLLTAWLPLYPKTFSLNSSLRTPVPYFIEMVRSLPSIRLLETDAP